VVTTWMGDCLQTGKPSRCVTNHQGQLSLSSFRGKSSTACLAGVDAGAFIYVRCQVSSHMAGDAP